MSKARIIGPSTAGGLSRGVNVNLNTAGGNKKQGLPLGVGHYSYEQYRKIKTKAMGDKREFIFTLRQLSGVGRHKTPFIAGADGIHAREPYRYTT